MCRRQRGDETDSEQVPVASYVHLLRETRTLVEHFCTAFFAITLHEHSQMFTLPCWFVGLHSNIFVYAFLVPISMSSVGHF